MESNKKYWKGLEELHNTKDFAQNNKNEFAEPLPIEEVLNEAGLSTVAPRRDFLKALGFGLGAVTLAACQRVPVHKSIPYLIKPEEVVPGIPDLRYLDLIYPKLPYLDAAKFRSAIPYRMDY